MPASSSDCERLARLIEHTGLASPERASPEARLRPPARRERRARRRAPGPLGECPQFQRRRLALVACTRRPAKRLNGARPDPHDVSSSREVRGERAADGARLSIDPRLGHAGIGGIGVLPPARVLPVRPTLVHRTCLSSAGAVSSLAYPWMGTDRWLTRSTMRWRTWQSSMAWRPGEPLTRRFAVALTAEMPAARKKARHGRRDDTRVGPTPNARGSCASCRPIGLTCCCRLCASTSRTSRWSPWSSSAGARVPRAPGRTRRAGCIAARPSPSAILAVRCRRSYVTKPATCASFNAWSSCAGRTRTPISPT